MLIDNGIFRLIGKIQNYSWGGYEFIPDLIGFTPEPGLPYAEYWMGSHKSAPSEIISADEARRSLDHLLSLYPEEIVGKAIFRQYGDLPFLFKVLDVREMLSIQVHPNKPEAEAGFATEDSKGIPIDSATRNYKDKNHKPEIMVALSEFWLLHGFLPADQIVIVLESVPEFQDLKPMFQAGGYAELYKQIMEMPSDHLEAILGSIWSRIQQQYDNDAIDKSSPDYWVAKYIKHDGAALNDPGLVSIYFFNVVHLHQGQAIFQDAGVPHAYLEGQNIELMAGSDNVLRGGLTRKHVDVNELLKLVKFNPTVPVVIEGESSGDPLETHFEAPARDFHLSAIQLKRGDVYTHRSSSAEIILIMKGQAQIRYPGVMQLEKGDSLLICHERAYQIEGLSDEVIMFKASVPAL